MSTLTNIETDVTIDAAVALAQTALEAELGLFLIAYLEVPIPLWPFVALGESIYALLTFFGGGKPVTVDTNNLIRAYNMSAYWPLRALASDLTIALKNGAPISDSRPAIQAQFGVWKQGTVTSLQGLAGAQQGPGGDGYWQFFNLIELTWRYASDYNMAFKIVKAIDQFTIGLSQFERQPKTPPPGDGGGGGGTGGGPNPVPNPIPGPPPGVSPCDSGNPDNDEILDLCNSLQSAIDKLGSTAQTPGVDPQCCRNVTQAIKGVTAELTVIATALSLPGPTPPPIDLTAIVKQLGDLVTAVGAIGPGPAVDLGPLVDEIAKAAAVLANFEKCVCDASKASEASDADALRKTRAAIQYWSGLGIGDSNVTQIVLS